MPNPRFSNLTSRPASGENPAPMSNISGKGMKGKEKQSVFNDALPGKSGPDRSAGTKKVRQYPASKGL